MADDGGVAGSREQPGAGLEPPEYQTYVVRRGDSLWRIAEEQLGDPNRFADIAELNDGRRMPDGTVFSYVEFLQPGWVLIMPPDMGRHTRELEPEPVRLELESGVSGLTSSPASGLARRESTFATTRHDSGKTVAATGGLLAAGVVSALGDRRRRKVMRRRPGERISMRPPGDWELELSRIDNPTGQVLVDAALRTLSAKLTKADRGLPDISLTVLKPHGLELHLVRPQPPVAPFYADPRRPTVWICPLGAPVGSPPGHAPAPYPALVSMGFDEDDDTVLVDLESTGGVSLLAPEAEAVSVLRAIAVELATGMAAGQVEVTLVGFGAELPPLFAPGRLTFSDDLAGAVEALARWSAGVEAVLDRRGVTVRKARTHPDEELAAITKTHVLLSAVAPDARLTHRLRHLLSGRPRTSIAVVAVAGDAEGVLSPWAIGGPLFRAPGVGSSGGAAAGALGGAAGGAASGALGGAAGGAAGSAPGGALSGALGGAAAGAASAAAGGVPGGAAGAAPAGALGGAAGGAPDTAASRAVIGAVGGAVGGAAAPGIALRVQALREERYEAVVRELSAADAEQEKPVPREGAFNLPGLPAGVEREASAAKTPLPKRKPSHPRRHVAGGGAGGGRAGFAGGGASTGGGGATGAGAGGVAGGGSVAGARGTTRPPARVELIATPDPVQPNRFRVPVDDLFRVDALLPSALPTTTAPLPVPGTAKELRLALKPANLPQFDQVAERGEEPPPPRAEDRLVGIEAELPALPAVPSPSGPARSVLAAPAASATTPRKPGQWQGAYWSQRKAAAARLPKPGAANRGVASRDAAGAAATYAIDVLGPIVLAGAERSADLAEVAAYVMLHPGCSVQQMAEELWPAQAGALGIVDAQVMRLREVLGGEGHDEPLPLLRVTPESVTLAPSVTCDWLEFLQRTQNGELVGALSLVRGRPFEDAPLRRYGWAQTLRHEMAALVIDTAHYVAEACLREQSPRNARKAALRGLAAAPESELLYRDLLTALAALGDLPAARRHADALLGYAEREGLPLQPETAALLRDVARAAARA